MVLADIGAGDAFSSRDRVARSSRLREANEAGSTPCPGHVGATVDESTIELGFAAGREASQCGTDTPKSQLTRGKCGRGRWRGT
jgi:hypothetical protein